MKLLLFILFAFAACATTTGYVTEGTTQTGFSLIVAWILGPLWALISWPLGKLLGQKASVVLTGTESQQMPVPGSDPIIQPDPSMTLIITCIVVYILIQLGIFKLVKIKVNGWLAAKFKELDDEWVKKEYEPWKASVERRLNEK